MTLTTLLICDDPNRQEPVEQLIKSNAQLVLVGVATSHEAESKLSEAPVQVIWIELSPDPQASLKLLEEMQAKHASTHFLVSYEKLQADLVKTAMQHGAVEYIDPDGAHRLLPGAVARIERDISTPPPPPVKPTLAPPPPLVVHSTEPHPKTNRDVKGVRSKVSSLEEGWGGLPYWVVPLVAIILLIAVIVLAIAKH